MTMKLLKDMVWKLPNGDVGFRHANNYYKVVSLNSYNDEKLARAFNFDMKLKRATVDQDGENSYKFILIYVITPKSTLAVFGHAERCMSDEKAERFNEIVSAFSDSISGNNDGKDYREIHPDGSIAKGVKDGIPYEEVLDKDGNVTYTVLVRDNCLVGMYFSQDCYAVVEVGDGKDIKDTIREVEGKSEFVNEIRDVEYDGMTDDEVICDCANRELACPRWGMSW